jgi:putative ABC transport system ATP-binding protein|nr:ABC transporter ATP-binding protein [Candidatus Nitrosotalea bavarica]
MIELNLPKNITTGMISKSPQTSDDIVLKIEHVTKIFDSASGRVVALEDINFTVKRGQFVSIMGPSGCGKSTLLNIIGALDRPTSGNVSINGHEIFSLGDSEIATMRNRLIGYIFQSYNLVNRSTVEINVKLPAIIAGMSTSEANRRAKKVLEELGIADKAKQKPANLSGGQQQRVAIARCLINNPAIILADEPTGNLDTKTGQDIFDMLKLLSHKFGRTIIMVTHNPELAAATDRSVLIKDGKIEKDILNKNN